MRKIEIPTDTLLEVGHTEEEGGDRTQREGGGRTEATEGGEAEGARHEEGNYTVNRGWSSQQEIKN